MGKEQNFLGYSFYLPPPSSPFTLYIKFLKPHYYNINKSLNNDKFRVVELLYEERRKGW